nr:hypothetical protein StreXyl84_05410 [Streptomyces sp. Xyl84]
MLVAPKPEPILCCGVVLMRGTLRIGVLSKSRAHPASHGRPGAGRGEPRPDGGITAGADLVWARMAVASRRDAPQGFSRTIVPLGNR